MPNHDKWFYYTLGAIAIIMITGIRLYIAAKTTEDFFGLCLMVALITLFCLIFILELHFVNNLIERITEYAEDSSAIYNLAMFSFFIFLTIIIPLSAIQTIKSSVEDKKNIPGINCPLVISQLLDSSKSIYNLTLLRKCEYTRPLAQAIALQSNKSQDGTEIILKVAGEYYKLTLGNGAFGLTLIFATVGGGSYLPLVLLAGKNMAILLIRLLSSIAMKLFEYSIPPPR